MRAVCCCLLIALVVGVVGASSGGCGSVKATPDAGGGSDAAVDTSMGGCTANAMSCGTDNALYQCDATGMTLTKVQDCQYGCSVDHCKECAANTTFCSGDDLVMCSSDGMIVNPMVCTHGCQQNRCNTCDPGVAYCSGTTAITCAQDGTPGAMMSCGAAGCAGGVCNACTPSTTTCQGDTLVVCGANGTVSSTTSCALGCATSPSTHCKALVPSYGIPAPSGTNLPNLLVDMDATLNITTCSGSAPTATLTIGTTMTTLSAPQVSVLTQISAPPICIVRFNTVTVQNGTTLTIVNDSTGHGLSLQAVSDMDIAGIITFTNGSAGPSPGATVQATGQNSNSKYVAPGPGGGGGSMAGGAGGACISCGSTTVPGGAGGSVVNPLTRFWGGSVGGGVDTGMFSLTAGAVGGGALHLVSLTRVNFAATAGIALNGRGGAGVGSGTLNNNTTDLPAAGGGSGGTLLVESPVVSVSTGATLAANGGGGAGGCYYVDQNIFRYFHANGQPGQLSDVRAAGGDCPSTTNGDGGYGVNGVTTPSPDGATSDPGGANQDGGGGGGAPGFIMLRGRMSGSVMVNAGSIVSPAPTVGTVTAN